MSYTSRPSYQILFGGPVSRAVKSLLIINTVVFCFQQLDHLAGSDQLTVLLGLRPVSVWQQLQLWRPMTYLFLHGDFFHIIFNMLSLYFFGPELERLWGTSRFYRYYFVTGVGAALCTVAVGPWSPTITIGASGAIYGILLAYGLNFPNRIVYIYALFPIKVKYMVIGMTAFAFFASIGGSGGGIAHWTHLSGLLVGFIYLMAGRGWSQWHHLYRRWKLERSKSKFQVYYRESRQRSNDKGRPPTIH